MKTKNAGNGNRMVLEQWMRWLGGGILIFLAGISMMGARRSWTVETQMGEAQGRIQANQEGPAVFRALARALDANPYDGMARYLLGSAMLRVEMRNAKQGQGASVDSRSIAEGIRHLEQSAGTAMHPARPMLALGQGLLFSARRQRSEPGGDSRAAEMAARAALLMRRSLLLEPQPKGNPLELWFETARAADLARASDIAAEAANAMRRLEWDGLSLSPENRLESWGIEQNGYLALGVTPGAAAAIARRWSAKPEDKELWNHLAGVSRMTQGRPASLAFMDLLIRRFPNEPIPKQYRARIAANE